MGKMTKPLIILSRIECLVLCDKICQLSTHHLYPLQLDAVALVQSRDHCFDAAVGLCGAEGVFRDGGRAWLERDDVAVGVAK